MPTTTGIATEFIQFSRTSNATVTDSDGKIKWAPANLLLNSESFDTASWAKTTTTVAANSIAAPNGTTTADTLTAAGANSTTLQSYTSLAVPYTFGVWLKRKTGTGNIQIAADSGTYTTVTITSDWALYTVAQTPAAGTISAGIRIVTSADEVYVWGAALYRSDLGGMQPNTSAYPFYNPTTPKNLVGYTEDFSGAGWTRVGLLANGSGSVANAIANPINGLQTADLTVESTSTGYHSIYGSFTCVSGTPYLWSAYVKPAGRTIVQIAAQATSNVHIVEFDLTGSGTATTRSGSGTAAITALSDGWYRVSTIATATGSGTGYWQIDLCSAANTNSYTGNGTSGIYLWGAQLSDSGSLDTYSPVYGAAVTSAAYYGPRRDFNGSTLACNGLLVEELRTNLATNSAAFNEASWLKTSVSVTANDAIAPDGTLTADLVTLTGSPGADQQLYNFDTQTGSHTVSFYLKAKETADVGTTIRLDTTGGGANATTITLTASWVRYTLTFSPTGYFQYRLISSAGYTATKFLVWGAQLEAGSFATSYIPTGSTSATRNPDVATVSTQAFPYSQPEGSLVVNFTPTETIANNTRVTELSGGGSARVIDLYSSGTSWVIYNGTTSFTAGTPVLGAITKIAAAYKTGSYGMSVNGGAVTADASSLVNTATAIYIGGNSVPSSLVNGHIRQITYLPRRISNAELVTRSA